MTRGFGRFVRQNTIALLALFLALGGTSFAAAALINGSQIKPHTIAKNRLTNKAIKQLKGNRGPRGLQGPKGTTGAQGAQGVQGVQGVQGPPGPFPDPLSSGKTLRGHFGMEGYVASPAQLQEAYSFGFTLASAPTGVFVPSSGPNPDPTHCSGSVASPAAAPGFLCLYERQRGSGTPNVVNNDKYGFEVYINATGGSATYTYSLGTWAVTAP